MEPSPQHELRRRDDPALQRLWKRLAEGIIAWRPPVMVGRRPAAYPGLSWRHRRDRRQRSRRPLRFATRQLHRRFSPRGILAPVERGGHAYVSGTSFAAAYVRSIAASLEREPRLNATDLIMTGADTSGRWSG
jgi:hypothetical protein